MMLSTAFLVVLFAVFTSVSSTAYAATATWNQDALEYNGQSYTGPLNTDNVTGLEAIPTGAQLYQYLEKSSTKQLAHIIYFAPGGIPKSSKEASYVVYTLNPPNAYTLPSSTTQITVDASSAEEAKSTTDSLSTCTIDGVGWIVCPVMGWIAKGMDTVYSYVKQFLYVAPLSQSVDNPAFRVWSIVRDFANVVFVLGFIVVIYSYMSGFGVSNYDIRKILPKIVVVALLVNVSYVLSTLLVDISNVMGNSVFSLFNNALDELTGSVNANSLSWQQVTSAVLSGGTAVTGATIAAGLGIKALQGALISEGLFWAVAPFLLAGILIILVTFLILAARQAILMLLIVLSPLAFASLLLPNTDEWFKRWRSTFFTMLVMFPAFSAVFGGAQLAGQLIIRSATTWEMAVLGLGVQIAPLAITPLLLKLGGGLLNRIAGIVNDPRRGLVDRFRNYSKERFADSQARLGRANATALRNGTLSSLSFTRRYAARAAQKDFTRKKEREANISNADASMSDNDHGYETWRSRQERWLDAKRGKTPRPSRFAYGMEDVHTTEHDTHLLQGYTTARHEDEYNKLVQNDPNRRAMRTATHLAKGKAAIRDEAMTGQDERTLKKLVETSASPEYAALRDMKVQSSVDKGVGDMYGAKTDASGEQEFRRAVAESRNLTQLYEDTDHAKRIAKEYETIVEKASSRNWSNRVISDAPIQELYARARSNDEQAKLAEKDLEIFTEKMRSKGSSAIGVTAGAAIFADQMKDLGVQIAARDYAIEEIKTEQKGNLLEALNTSKSLRTVAGGGTKYGATKVHARAQNEMTKMHLENVKAQTSIYSNDGYRVDELLKAMQDHEIRGNEPADDVAQQAAIQHIMESIGNNWSVQKVIDWADSQGMELIEGKNGQPDKYYDAAAYRAAKQSGGPLPTELDTDEVSRRRDMLQMVVAGYKNGKNKVSYFSNTLQERMNRGLSSARYSPEVGRELTFSESAILSESKQGKYEAERFATADPDELSRMVQALRDPEYRKLIPREKRDNIRAKIIEAQSSNQTRHRIKDRERGLMNVVAAYLELGENDNPADIEEVREMENFYYEEKRTDDSGDFYVRVPASRAGDPGVRRAEASTKAPNVYSVKRQDDIRPSGVGKYPPGQKPPAS
ncbi:hypothetical protein KBD87_02650 [Candidatus Saccharibacteria bacterium]|nr:hypothetical protein [Candidatus Saccharibacteria bacterium]